MDQAAWQNKGAGHRQRLREKFLDRGIEAFSDDEVLELLLSFGTPRKDCKEAARTARQTFGGLAAVLEAPPGELQKVKGVGPKNAFALHFVQGVARRYLKTRLIGKDYLNSSREVAAYLVHTMRDLKREVFKAIFLDAGHAIIDTEIIAEGTINVNTIYPRELVKRALHHHAAALIVAHNHPSGSLKPSPQDLHLTRTLFLVCSFMHIQLLDHLIIGKAAPAGDASPVFSFADHGTMAEIRTEYGRLLNNYQVAAP